VALGWLGGRVCSLCLLSLPSPFGPYRMLFSKKSKQLPPFDDRVYSERLVVAELARSGRSVSRTLLI